MPGRPGVVVARRADVRRQPGAAPPAGEGLLRAGAAGLARARRASTGPRTSGRAAGPRRTSRSARTRSAPGCTPRACAGSPTRAGPSAAATWPTATATPSRASTSPGAPARASSSRSSAASGPRASTCASATGWTSWWSAAAPSPACAARCSRRARSRRGQQSDREEAGDFELTAQAVRRRVRRHRRQPRARPLLLAGAAREAAAADALRRARPRRRAHARDLQGGRRQRDQRRPHVALRRGHPQLGPDLAHARDPDHPRAERACGSTPRAAGSRSRCSRASTRSARSPTSSARATTTRGSC